MRELSAPVLSAAAAVLLLLISVANGGSPKPSCSPYSSVKTCIKAAQRDRRGYMKVTCVPILSMRATPPRHIEEEGPTERLAQGSNFTNSSVLLGIGGTSATGASSGEGTDTGAAADACTTGKKAKKCYPQSMPDSSFDQRVTFLKDLLAQGQAGTLIDQSRGNTSCAPMTAFFDYVLQFGTYALGNLGMGLGMILGPAVGMSVGSSGGQSIGYATAPTVTSLLTPLEMAAAASAGGGTTRRDQAIPLRPKDTALAGMAAGSGIGLGSGFAVGVPAGMAAGGLRGKRIGTRLTVWLIQSAAFATAYFSCLMLAFVMNGLDIIVDDGITNRRIQKLYRYQIQAQEDRIFQIFTDTYNRTNFYDFTNSATDTLVAQNIISSLRSVGVLSGLSAGLPVGAAIGTYAGSTFGTLFGAVPGAAADAGAAAAGVGGEGRADDSSDDNTAGRSRRAQSAASLVTDVTDVDILLALGPIEYVATSIAIGVGAAVGSGAGRSEGWKLGAPIGYAAGLLAVNSLVQVFALAQNQLGQAILNQVTKTLSDMGHLRNPITLTYTPYCDFANYSYPIQPLDHYDRTPYALNKTAVWKAKKAAMRNKKASSSSATSENSASSSDTSGDQALWDMLVNSGEEQATRQKFGFTKAAEDFLLTTTGTPAAVDKKTAFRECRAYAWSEYHRRISACYLDCT